MYKCMNFIISYTIELRNRICCSLRFSGKKSRRKPALMPQNTGSADDIRLEIQELFFLGVEFLLCDDFAVQQFFVYLQFFCDIQT